MDPGNKRPVAETPETIVLVVSQGDRWYYKLARHADFTMEMHEWLRTAEDLGYAGCSPRIKAFVGGDYLGATCDFPWYEEGSGSPMRVLKCVVYCVRV